MGQQITLPGRASYLHAFKPRGNPAKNIPERFSVNLILPLNYDFTPVQAAIDAACTEKYGATIPAGLTMPWKWGDPTKEAEKDHVLIKVYAAPDSPPLGVDQNNQPIIDPALLYSGCDVLVSMNIYAHANNGVSAWFQAIRLERAGEHLDNVVSAEGVFGAGVPVPAAAPGAPGPAATGQPAGYPAPPVAAAPATAPAPGPAAAPPTPAPAPVATQPQTQPQQQPPVQYTQPGNPATQPPLPGVPGNDNGFIPPQ